MKYQKAVRQFLPVCLILAQLLFFTGTSFAEDFMKDLIGQFGVGLSVTLDTGKHHRIDTAELDSNKIVRVTKESDDMARVMLETHFFYVPKDYSFLKVIDAGQWGWGPFVGFVPGSGKVIESVGGGLMVGFLRKDKSLSELKCEVKAKDSCKTADASLNSECESLEKKRCEVNSITDCESDAVKVCQGMSSVPDEEKKLCRAEAKEKCKAVTAKGTTKDSFNIGIGLMMDPSAKILGDGITENQPLPAGETQVRLKETSQWGFLIMSSYSF